jgi:hypothetical protein
LNRLFLGRATDYVVRELGIRQIVDIGSGLPTVGPVHDVAEQAAPGQVRVIYIDNEPVAQAHASRLLAANADTSRALAIWADFVDGEGLWERVMQTGLIDLDQPVALFVVALLHFMTPAQQPEKHLSYFREQLPPGSALVLSHVTDELGDPDAQARLTEVVDAYREHATHEPYLRGLDKIAGLFGDFELVEHFPGATQRRPVWLPQWRPNQQLDTWWHPGWEFPPTMKPQESIAVAGVGVKPGCR